MKDHYRLVMVIGDVKEFLREVNDLIEEGFKPLGHPIINDVVLDGVVRTYFYQALN